MTHSAFLIEITEETSTRSLTYYHSLTQRRETHQSSHLSVKEYQTRLCETQRLHIKACQETTTLRRELDELRTQLQIQQRRLEYEARQSMLEEHKKALMLLRGRRIADGSSAPETSNVSRVNSGEMESQSHNPPEVPSLGTSTPEVTPQELTHLPACAHPELETLAFNLDNTRTEVTSEPETNLTPEVPLMISVATSTDDLHTLGTDAESTDDEEPREEWNIRENFLCREDAEGRSRSVSPYTAEKKSYANLEASKSEVVYQLDEEVRKMQAFAGIRKHFLSLMIP